MSADREDEAQYFVRLLLARWQSVEGYILGDNLRIHTGEPGDSSRDPQLVVGNGTEIPRGASGYDAMQGDGSGFVRRPDGTLDIRCIGGTDDDVAGHPRVLSREFAREVERILAEEWLGLPDANTGEVVYTNLAPGVMTGPTSDPDEPGRWSAVQEAKYTFSTP